MIETLQPTKYDQSVDANCTKDEYITSNYGGLPNESMLEEQWDALPEAIEGKPLRVRWMLRFPLTVSMRNPARFYLQRNSDSVGLSGTGKIINGVIMPSGKVVLEWKEPHQTLGIYDNFQKFLAVHVENQPDSNVVVFID